MIRCPGGPGRHRCLALAAVLAAAACGGAGVEREGDPQLVASLRLSPTPPMVGEATVAAHVSDGGVPAPAGTAVTAAVTPVGGGPGAPRALEAGGAGRWEGRIAFPASGAVRVEVTVTLADGRSATFRFPVTVAQRPGG